MIGHRLTNGARLAKAACLALVFAGCGGGAPRAVEVTEAWTSGDERALGIEAPAESSTSEASSEEPAGDD
jgi:hypothetical protein